MAQKLLPKVITLDVKMPEVDGWETLSLLKKEEKLHKTPIVMISMIDEKETGYRALLNLGHLL